MKNNIFFLTMLCLLFGCKEPSKESSTFSNLIDYQHHILTNNRFEIPVETYKIRYQSDGLEITGYISKQKNAENQPAIIVTRGGNRNLGTFGVRNLYYQQFLASNGYVVLSSQLRGNIFSEGEDEFGGKDLNDILKLIEINKTLEFTNEKIGVHGTSRGGLNAYQISRITDDIDAIAVVGAPTALSINFKFRPEMYEKVYKELVGDTIQNKAAYEYRNPILWVDEINEPTLILHGSDDQRVQLTHAKLMIEKMKTLNKTFDYHIFEGGNHGLGTHWQAKNRKVLNWFHKYLKQK